MNNLLKKEIEKKIKEKEQEKMLDQENSDKTYYMMLSLFDLLIEYNPRR